jgi:hypothetical protein
VAVIDPVQLHPRVTSTLIAEFWKYFINVIGKTGQCGLLHGPMNSTIKLCYHFTPPYTGGVPSPGLE